MERQNFLDNLDGVWSSVISNTYEQATNLEYVDSEINLFIKIDFSSLNIFTNDDEVSYQETYLTSDGLYKIEFALIYMLDFLSGDENDMMLQLGIFVKENETNKDISYCGSIYSLNSDNDDTSTDDDRPIKINHEFFKAFTNRAIKNFKQVDNYLANERLTEDHINSFIKLVTNNIENI